MIRRLRDRHRRLIVVLALLTGLALMWALLVGATAPRRHGERRTRRSGIPAAWRPGAEASP